MFTGLMSGCKLLKLQGWKVARLKSCKIEKLQGWKVASLKSCNRQQPSPLLYSIDIWPARNSRLTQREPNHYITRCPSELAWPYLAGSSPGQLVIDLFAQHQRFIVCCQLTLKNHLFALKLTKTICWPIFALMQSSLKERLNKFIFDLAV